MAKADEGVKHDGGKPPWDLAQWRALAEYVRVLEFGAKKYSPDNWRKVPELRRRYYAAALRHLVAWWSGERNDPESGLHHLAHTLCCVAFILETELEGESK